MKKEISLKVSDRDYNLIKKKKKSLIIQLNDDENKKIKAGNKIMITDTINKPLKKKVKKIYNYLAVEELAKSGKKKQLGFQKKDTVNYDDVVKEYKKDIQKYGLLGIEIKNKKHIVRNILLGILLLLILFFGFLFVKGKIDDIKAKKLKNTLNELAKERIDYVFIEINPSMVFTVKGNKVQDVGCLNDDCISIYQDLDIKGKNINDSIDFVYQISKEKGFDISNGVKIKISSNIKIEEKDYITVEYINRNKEQELLKKVKNNEDIKNVSNDDYYGDLWKKLKKDSDYGYTYSCTMENNELKCYITEKFLNRIDHLTMKDLPLIPKIANDMLRTLDKFGVKYDTEDILGIANFVNGIYINGVRYSYTSYTIGNSTIIECSEMQGKTTKKINGGTLKTEYSKENSSCYKDELYIYDSVLSMDTDDDTEKLIPFTKFNLLTSQYDSKDILDDHIKAREEYENQFIDVASCETLDRIGVDKWLCSNENKDAFYLCNITNDSFRHKKEDCTLVTKQLYTNIESLTKTCYVPSVDYIEKRDVECEKTATTFERCNIDKNNFTKINCTTNYNTIPTEEEKEQMKIIEHRDDLIAQGYSLNREGMKEKCPTNSIEGTCEYLCLYHKDSEGYDNRELEPIACELIIFD